MVEKIERRRCVEISLVFFDSVDAGYIFVFFETHITIMMERIWINRVSREIVFMTVREGEWHVDSRQQDVTHGMQSPETSS